MDNFSLRRPKETYILHQAILMTQFYQKMSGGPFNLTLQLNLNARRESQSHRKRP